jgi:heme exporter protein C
MKHWWKVLAIILMPPLLYAAWMQPVSTQTILHETIRNLYFHVVMWMAMFVLFTISLVNSIAYLAVGDLKYDIRAKATVQVGMLYGTVGIFTGMVWANNTWGAPWVNDPQLNSAAITMVAYLAYLILHGSISGEQKRGKVAAVYNIFAFVLMFILLGIYPRLNESLHPGKGDNPGFGNYKDISGSMRYIFYGSILVWTLVGIWTYSILCRMKRIENSIKEKES